MNKEEYGQLLTRENVEKIKVPEIVKDDLLSFIEEKLDKAGFYYRIAYRVKAVDSMVSKLNFKEYGKPGSENEDKKMQDLIGIRIILYFSDDMMILRKLLDTLFSEPGEWETTENNEYEFKAMKTNGIFKLPSYLSKSISNPVLSAYIDDTFEVQVRTNAFEGWHEIEHDLRYKGSAFGIGNESLARKMNSILATLELCDDSIVKLLEDLGHQHYKDLQWEDMIRCHYRLKLQNEPLSPEIKSVLDADTEIAKRIYKFDRGRAIEQLWKNTTDRGVELTVDNIIRIVNAVGLHEAKLEEAFAVMDAHRRDRETSRRKKFEPFRQLGRYTVFRADTWLNLANLSKEDAFRKAAGYIYSWVRSRFGEVFPDIPEETASYYGLVPGYQVEVTYQEDKCYFRQCTSHLDSKIASRLWISIATLEQAGEQIRFTVSNEYAEPKEAYRDPENVLFSRPNFYGEIADNIGLFDGERMKESVKEVKEEELETLEQSIRNADRQFPIVVFMAQDETWKQEFDIDYFAYLVGYYTHVKMVSGEQACRHFAEKYHLNPDRYMDSITIFFPGKAPQTDYKQDILETTFEVIKLEKKKYWNEKGCRAYRRQLVAQIRQENVEKCHYFGN